MSDLLGGHIVWFWTTILLHFIWQGLAVASIIGVLLCAIPPAESSKRYWLLVFGLLCMIAMPITTGFLLEVPQDRQEAAFLVDSGPVLPASLPVSARSPAVSEALLAAPKSDVGWLRDLLSDSATAETTLRAVAFCTWIVAQVLLSGRLLMGGLVMWQIRRTASSVSENVQSTAVRLASELGMRRVPLVVASTRIVDAATAGFLRSTVILPAAWLTQLSPEMIEAVLAHEFSHVRRHDLWINLVQRVVEMVFFYHPAVWWLSGRMRIEREHCCDASAVAVTGAPTTFARTLELAAMQRTGIEFGLATNLGGQRMSLLNRVNRVLGQTRTERNGTRWPLGLVALLIPTMLLIHAKQATSVAAAPQAQPVIEQESGKPPVAYFPAGQTPPETPLQAAPFEFQVQQQRAVTSLGHVPTELKTVSLPDYIIEPPDILLIDGIKLVPKGPQKIETQDVLQIVVLGTQPDRPIAGQFAVEGNGTVNLGPGYGSVKLDGLTLQAATATI